MSQWANKFGCWDLIPRSQSVATSPHRASVPHVQRRLRITQSYDVFRSSFSASIWRLNAYLYILGKIMNESWCIAARRE
jgi:hypothetical protein